VYRSLVFASLLIAQNVNNPACGSSTPMTPATLQNTQMTTVYAGPTNDYFNGLFTSVTVCVPGQASNCQTIGGILVDTGSTGLRLLSSALTLTLPQQTINGNPVATCGEFATNVTWGPVQSADIKLAGEQASSVPIQVIGAPGFDAIPADCSSAGPPQQTLSDLGANGILGISVFRQDCGIACAVTGASNPGLYYTCAAGRCQSANEPLNQQLQNPIWLFSADNNGAILQLPSVAAGGASSANGTLIFGIGTQSDNALGSAKVFTTDGIGNITTQYGSQSYSSSYIDSGTNGYYFLDAATTGLPVCPDNTDFYCPPALRQQDATIRGANGASSAIAFNIGNADQYLNNLNFSVFGEIGGPSANSFAWGLPFFYGRTVFVGIEGQSSPGGTGPFNAF
jgi:hypothetical protein